MNEFGVIPQEDSSNPTYYSRKIISTWIYFEEAHEGGVYSQVTGVSHTRRFHDVYRRCLITFFYSARSANPEAHLLLFTNKDIRLENGHINRKLLTVLEELKVEIVTLNYTYTPPLQQKLWRNQFFVLDILSYLAQNVDDNDLCLILDSDIVWSGNNRSPEFWEKLDRQNILTMTPIENRNEIINGLTIDELRSVASQVIMRELPNFQYIGGEFIALKGFLIRNLQTRIRENWNAYNVALGSMKMEYWEEAHFLSITFANLAETYGNGNDFIKRIWTSSFGYSNKKYHDHSLVLWHLPAEKRFGIHRLANSILRDGQFTWPIYGSEKWVQMAMSLGILGTSKPKYLLDISKYLIDEIVKAFEKRFTK